MGRISDIMDSFKTHKALIDIPAAWRIVLASFPQGYLLVPRSDQQPGMLEPADDSTMPYVMYSSACSRSCSCIQPE